MGHNEIRKKSLRVQYTAVEKNSSSGSKSGYNEQGYDGRGDHRSITELSVSVTSYAAAHTL